MQSEIFLGYNQRLVFLQGGVGAEEAWSLFMTRRDNGNVKTTLFAYVKSNENPEKR